LGALSDLSNLSWLTFSATLPVEVAVHNVSFFSELEVQLAYWFFHSSLQLIIPFIWNHKIQN